MNEPEGAEEGASTSPAETPTGPPAETPTGPPTETSLWAGVDCPPVKALPAGCRRLLGTDEDARWLECWRQRSWDLFNIVEGKTFAVHSCPLETTALDEVASDCRKRGGVEEKFLCLVTRVFQKNLTDSSGGGGCAESSLCMRQIAGRMDLSVNVESGSIPFVSAHSWVEVAVEDQLLILDGKNRIAYRCP